MLVSLKEILFKKSSDDTQLKEKITKFEDLEIKLVNRYKFQLVAKTDSEVYTGTIKGSFYLQFDISQYQKEFSNGVVVQEADKNDLDVIKDALKNQYLELGIYWS